MIAGNWLLSSAWGGMKFSKRLFVPGCYCFTLCVPVASERTIIQEHFFFKQKEKLA